MLLISKMFSSYNDQLLLTSLFSKTFNVLKKLLVYRLSCGGSLAYVISRGHVYCVLHSGRSDVRMDL